MALSWTVSNGKDVRTNFSRVSATDTVLVDKFYTPFIRDIEDFFKNTPKVKEFNYIIVSLGGGIRSVEKQASISPTRTGGVIGGQSAHNYGMAIDFIPVRSNSYKTVQIGKPYTAHPGTLLEPYAVVIEALYNHPTLLSGATFPKLNDYNHIQWKDYRTLAKNIAPQYWRGTGPGGRKSTVAPQTSPPPIDSPRTPGISPFITANQSFHPHIQYELTRRRNATETANTYMPFIKLTSLVKVYNANLQDVDVGNSGSFSGSFGAYCPTLGVHGLRGRDQTTFESIYYPTAGRSIVGYASKEVGNNTIKLVPVVVENNEEDPPNIPPPGIISMTSERTTSGGFGIRGGLFKATLNIRAYSLGQVNTLLKYFIRQGTKVVLEIGRTSSSPAELLATNSTELAEFRNGLKLDTTKVAELFQKFNWQRTEEDIKKELDKVITVQEGQQELIEKYTYNNFGNYEIFVGYVATFRLRYTKDNVYEIELVVHSVQQFEVPTKLGGTRALPSSKLTVPNTCEAVDIMDYFKPESAYRDNSFLKILARCSDKELGGKLYEIWGNHVIPLRAAGGQAGSGGIKSNGYLLSWECFVDLILNDSTYGLLGTFQLQTGIDDKTISVLRSGLLSRIGSTKVGRAKDINSNEVSWHKSLRSTDPNIMIIYNRYAQSTARDNYATQAINVLKGEGKLSESDIRKIELGAANLTIRQTIESSTVGAFDPTEQNTSYLTKGVWINSNAIIDAFSSADTITAGLTNLLNSMNNATQGYWNLQVLSAEPEVVGLRVIDAGLSKPVDAPLVPQKGDFGASLPTSDPTKLINRLREDVKKFINSDGSPQFLYVFNRKLQRWLTDDLGSELLDINIDASMPNVIAVQAIAGIGGVAQRGVLASIDVDELKAISMFDTYPASNQSSSTCAETPSVLTDKNTNKTLTTEQIGRISAAIKSPLLFAEEGGSEGVIKTITEEAINKWKKDNEELIKAGTVTEEAGKALVQADIESVKQIPVEQYEKNNPGMLSLVREFAATFGQAIDLVENNVSLIVSLLDANKQEEEIHPFNVSNLTKTVVDLTIPGIGGILLFQAFAVDRVPNILRRGYYIVTKVAHEFSVDSGWTTKIQGRFRFKPNMQGEPRT